MLSLFKAYPRLSEELPRMNLGSFPTPVQPLKEISRRTGKNVYIKRDDLCAEPYGGNKVRKLEFILAHASQCGAERIITSGGAGSNHALATALYAGAAGFKTTLMLFNQPNALSVRDNLLADLTSGAELFLDDNYESHRLSLKRIVEKYKAQEVNEPYLIAPGGSSPLGSIGFVNAGFELAEQIQKSVLPLPSTIFVALGTMGTAAGLLLGLRAAGLPSRIHAVRVVPAAVANKKAFDTLFELANNLLREADPSFPRIVQQPDDICFDNDHFGEGYGIHSEEAQIACRTVRELEGIHLDGTYTGKTFAAILKNSADDSQNVLFWNTKNSRPLLQGDGRPDYHHLPSAFHHYFTESTQDSSCL